MLFFNDTATTEIYTLSLHDALPISGSGWHGLPRRVKPERPKEVAKIVDLLGAGEKFPQPHGTPGSEGANLGPTWCGLRTAMLRRGANQCGMANAECGMTRRPS